MPLRRYQVRNEYASSDPELYRQADKDDPEALLEAVSMSGLVGLLRQLGDLAEFAAEIFHDLHEEVLATASRGHGLMVRVQQLETEFPLIEKALLSQTNHSSLFYNTSKTEFKRIISMLASVALHYSFDMYPNDYSIPSTYKRLDTCVWIVVSIRRMPSFIKCIVKFTDYHGVDWHPSMRSQENSIAQGDLPRFIMDSYEECRAPPRLFLLDKFDVAGAGACLKRYSDPALFKEGTVLEDMQKEKKIRKIKKKGMRGKNGATPEFVQVPHAKLHQLFLEERVEISNSNLSRLVKLKRRQFNETFFCPKNGKSYMEKFVNTSSPDSKTVFEDPVARPALQWTSESTVPEAIEIQFLRSKEIGSQMKGKTLASRHSFSENSSLKHLNEMVIDEKEMMEPAFAPDEEADEILDLHDVQEMRLAKMAGKMENGVDGFHYDDITSEVENYVDAVATLESEVEADSEFEARTSKRFYNAGKHETDSITTNEQGEHQRQFSDSQSWDYSVSDDGNTFIRRGSSTFSYSDGQSNLIENVLSDSEGVGQAFPSSEAETSECIRDNQICSMLESTSEKPVIPTSHKEKGICTNSLSAEQTANLWSFLAEESSSNHITPVFSSLEGGDSIENCDDAVSSDIPPEKGKEHLSNDSINVKEVGELTVSSDPLQHPSSSLDLPYVAEIDSRHTRETFNNDEDVDNIDRGQCKSGLSFADVSSEDQLHSTGFSEVGNTSGFIPFHHSSTATAAIDVGVDKPVSAEVSEDILTVPEPNLQNFSGKEDILRTESKVQHYSLLDDTPINEQIATTDHCHDDEMKHEENFHASVGDARLAWKEDIDENPMDCDLRLTSCDDRLYTPDYVAMDPSKAASSAIISSSNENIASAESLSVDAVSTSYLKIQELGPEPATSYKTDDDIAGAYGDIKEEKVFQEMQSLNRNDLKSPGDFTFEMEEQCSSLQEEFSVLSDSKGIGQPVLDLEAKPTGKSDLPLSSEADLFQSLNYQHIEHEEKLEPPPEFPADASGMKPPNIDETVSERSCHTLEQMQSSSLLCREDILSKPGPPLEALLEVENHILDVEHSKDSKDISSLPGPHSDTVLLSDSTDDEYSNIFKSYADDQPSQLLCSKTLELSALPETKQDEATVSGLSDGVIPEEIPPIFSVDSHVHSIKDGGCLNSFSPTIVDQSPAPHYLLQASPAPSETEVLNSITALHREDPLEEDSESVSGLKTLDHSDKPAEHTLLYQEKKIVQSVWQPTDQQIDVASGQHPTSTIQGELLPTMSSESSPVSDSTEQQTLSGRSQAENGSLTGGSAQLEMRQDEQLPHGPLSVEGETASISPQESEVAEPAHSNIPRPPKRLIEAVAAHDRSMLRKVTERIWPPVEPKAEERGSLLEQIRTKSFNLKPAVAVRPSIQGPKTNLKVAAILERANAIRQAFAGSDEDDNDSWSDS